MLKIVLIILFIVLFVAMRKVKIKWKTFFHRGFKKETKPYGVYCYCGKQGKGKTYSVVEFLQCNKDKEIYSNIKSIKGIRYNYFSGFDELLKLRDKTDCIIVYDEIFTALTKSSKMNTDVLDFLSQMRKRRIIFITTAQEWLEINITLRRYCRFQIECNMISLFGYPILIKSMYDAEQMKWSQLDNEYVAPLCDITISHGMRKVINSYDTFEQISNDSSSVQVHFVQNEPKMKKLQTLVRKGSNINRIATTTISNSMVNGQDDDFWSDLNIKKDIENE